MLRRAYDRLLAWSASRSGLSAIGLISFAEASFFPIPPDIFLITAVLSRPGIWLRAALVCSFASVAGGLAGYFIGLAAWELVADLFYRFVPGVTPEAYSTVSELYRDWDFWVVFTAGFTPIPYKLFTIAAGVARINLWIFLVASAVSRSARFFLVAGLLRWLGPWFRPILERYFGWFTLGFTVLLVGGFAVLRYLLH